MKSKIDKLKNCMYELNITLSADEANKHLNLAYDKINKSVQVPGFRKGKAPIDVLKKNYEGLAKEELIDSVVPLYYQEAMKETDIEPVAEPNLVDINFEKDSGITFKIKIPMKPEIKLARYKGIKLAKKKADVTIKDVDDMLAKLKEQHAEFRSLESSQVKENDYIVCDIVCNVDGEVIEDKKNITLPVKKEFPIPELVKGLEGAKPKEEVSVEAILPEKIYEDKYAGKKGKFSIVIHEIKEKILPDLDDDFAKKLGAFEKLEDLKKKLEDDIKIYKKRQQEEDLQNQLVDKLLKYNKFSTPESLVEKEKEILTDQFNKNLASSGVKEQQADAYKEKMMKDINVQAEKRVRTYFLLSHIAQEEKIDINDKEIQDEINKLAESTRQTPESFKSYLKKEKLLGNFVSDIKVKKIMKFLLDSAKIRQE